MAFDAIQDAYDGLASPAKRSQYDQQLRKLKRARRWTPRRVRKWVGEYIDNWISSLMLMWVQQQRGELRGEVFTAVNSWKTHASQAAVNLMRHFALLPSSSDRLSLLHEHLGRAKCQFVLSGSLLAVFM